MENFPSTLMEPNICMKVTKESNPTPHPNLNIAQMENNDKGPTEFVQTMTNM